MADEMTGNGIGEQLAAFEGRLNQRVDALEGRLNERFEQIDRRFEQVDKRFEQVDRRFEQIDNRFEQIDRRFEQIDNRFEQVDRRFEQIDGRSDATDVRMDSIEHTLQVQFDETHRLIRLSLEGQTILKESMERRFDEADKKLDEQTDLLKQAQRHTADRVGRLERRR